METNYRILHDSCDFNITTFYRVFQLEADRNGHRRSYRFVADGSIRAFLSYDQEVCLGAMRVMHRNPW